MQATIPIDKIKLGERARKEFGDVEGLARSIEERGLINPLTVEDKGDGTYLLLAGERRYRALQLLGKTEVMVRIYKDVNEYMRKCIELHENIDRLGMDWKEKARLEAEIHEAKVALYGEPRKGKGGKTEGWTQSMTAQILGVDRSDVTRSIRLAEALETMPELEKCKTAHEATKTLARLMEKLVVDEIAARHEQRISSTAEGTAKLIKKLSDSYIVGDFLSAAKSIPDESFDFIYFDPPYGMDLDKVKTGIENHSYQEIPKDQYQEFINAALKECYRILKPNCWLVIWFAPDPWFNFLLEALRAHNFKVRGMPAMWLKDGATQSMQPSIHLGTQVEFFFYARKHEAQIVKEGRSNVFKFKPIRPDLKLHPTEKPVELMVEIFQTFTTPGSMILSPCLGSGNDILAAYNANMSCVGYDIDESHKKAYISKLVERLG